MPAADATAPKANANVISRRLKAAGHFRYFFAHGYTVTTISPGVVEVSVLGYPGESRGEELSAICTTLRGHGYNATLADHTYETSPGRTGSYPVVRVTD